jgi:pimeloyl-ACP methyl ester carboxylesterase
LLIAFIFSITLAANAQRVDTVKVKVHDHEMMLYVSGNGKPTVVLEAGGASNHKSWGKVHPEIAKFAKVISYDRPGYLQSGPCGKRRDAVTVAKELKEALNRAGILPPYVLAGWSMGGAFVRVFAGLYPKDVVGLMLVDPVPEESYARFEKEFPNLLVEDASYMKEVLSSNRIGEREEMRLFDSSINQARLSDKLHSTPTTLLIAAGKKPDGHDRNPSNPLNKIWIEELEKWALKRPNLKYEIIRNSGHHIAGDQPDTVVHIIRDVVRQYQAKALRQSASKYKKPEQLNDGIKTATLKEVGLNEKIINALTDSIINGGYPNIHSILIICNNKLVYENYFPGNDAIRGIGFVGFTDHHRDSLHDQRSVTKSVVSAAVMIAIGQGKIKSVDERVFDFFPEYTKYDKGMKSDITIKHLLTMSSGLEWNERVSYADPANSETRMDTASNPVEFFLSQRPIHKSGAVFNYSGGSTQVLAAIVAKATGLNVDDFTANELFKPLGISQYYWVKRKDGITIAASGLRLRSRDMAKIGLLYLNNGKWSGRQIIQSHLILQSLKSQISTPYNSG